MALFVVIALKDSSAAVDTAVGSLFPKSSYKIESGKWVIDADVTTSKELSVTLGLSQTHQHLALPLRGYHGRAQPDLWEWLGAQSTKTDA